MRNVIVGTAGHVDHGKSSLVEALTGTHPDRLEEEKRRGITLDLGFAFLTLPEVNFAFVDVPGHERFFRNMLAGASGFDIVLLVVAADERIKPQTREHLEICKLLGISHGLIALTKSDLVGPDALDLARLEIAEFARGSFLEGAPTIPASVKTREGLDRLGDELSRMARQVPSRDSSRYPRLPIDRSFAIKGFGTVVTGTLIDGQVAPGDEIEIFPPRRRLRVRGVQTEGRAIERATPGQRIALNLAGIDHSEMQRGMVVAAPNRFEPTTRLDVRIALLSSSRPLKHRARVHFHQGTAETVAESYLLAADEIKPGTSALVQLRLSAPTLVLPGDRFILRQFSPLTTIGGGVVIDALAPRHKSRDPQAISLLETLERGLTFEPDARIESLAALVRAAPQGMTLPALIARTGWHEDEIRATLTAAGKARIKVVSEQPFTVAAAENVGAYVARILVAIEKFHQANPLAPAISKEDLRGRLVPKANVRLFQTALDDLAAQGKVSVAGDQVKRAGYAVDLLPEELDSKNQIEREFARSGLAVPAVTQVLAGLPIENRRAEKLLQLLLREKILLRVGGDLVFHHAAVHELRKHLADYKRMRGPNLAIGEFKELTGITRKYAIPLLEYLDREHVTRRVGDSRVIL